ncbi:metal-dependent hydrolase [Bacillus sp. FJAT-47783]|uniref:metal-dependent hydrolase n=1 Tax=Bacillus sp. FJAT-47783 TaxID=2922712 RepID=UPI001FAE545A|nr:metal-dependent hydrolase [Bacillus sp. FJAT-47783]
MDTGTHVVMGIALGGIATLDSAVGQHAITADAVLISTIIGSQAPDLDTFLKFKNNATYIRNHRGWTHSIPAIILWSILITFSIFLFIPESNLFHLWLWTFIAVFLHVFVDIFNGYGTQALRPFSKKWVALGTINTFDPVIFIMHIIGIVIWLLGFDAGYTFLTIYILLIGYYIVKLVIQRSVVRAVHQQINEVEEIIFNPSIQFSRWTLAIKAKDYFYVVRANKGELKILDRFERVPLPKTDIIESAKKDANIQAFLYFSPMYRWEIVELNDHIEVRFIDLRYRSKEYYPFVAVVHLDEDHNILRSYTGWIFSEQRLQKKLDML